MTSRLGTSLTIGFEFTSRSIKFTWPPPLLALDESPSSSLMSLAVTRVPTPVMTASMKLLAAGCCSACVSGSIADGSKPLDDDSISDTLSTCALSAMSSSSSVSLPTRMGGRRLSCSGRSATSGASCSLRAVSTVCPSRSASTTFTASATTSGRSVFTSPGLSSPTMSSTSGGITALAS